MKRLFRNRDIKVIILEVFLIVLGLLGLTLGVKYIMNSINVNVDTSKLAIDNMNANVTNGTLTPIEDSSVNINTTSNVLRITFDVKGASTNTGNNIIYDAILNIDADCSLKNESVKWNLYKNNNLLTNGSTSPKYDKDVLNGKITLTDTQQDLVKYSGSADKYVFILWMSESCNEEDITKCDISKGLTSDSGGKNISGNIDIRLNSGKKKENKRETMDIDACSIPRGNAAIAIASIDDGTTGDSGSGVYKVTHSAIPAESSATGSEIPAVTDYRYYGPNPNNYILLPDMNTTESRCMFNDEELYNFSNINFDCEKEVVYKLYWDYEQDAFNYIPASTFEIVAPAGSMTYNETNSECLYNGSSITSIYEGNVDKNVCMQMSVINIQGDTYSVLITKMNAKPHKLNVKNGLYRIIGSIYDERSKTNRLKVIKATPLTDGTTSLYSWDSEGDISENIWAVPTSGNFSNSLAGGANIMKLLNSGIWWNGTSGIYENDFKDINVNFTNYKLSDKAKSYIDISRYYLGSADESAISENVYRDERGTLRYNENRSLYWDGMVGLMYPSDYGYAAGNVCAIGTTLWNYYGECSNKDWLYNAGVNQWLISPYSGFSYSVFNVNIVGRVSDSNCIFAFAVSPVFYLIPSASITSGTGTLTDPYILG